MEIAVAISLAKATIALLCPYLQRAGEAVAESVGNATYNKAKEVYEYIKTKFTDNVSAREALIDLETNPEDGDTQASARKELKKLLLADEAFAKELEVLIKGDTNNTEANSVFNTQINGNVKTFTQVGKVDGDLNIS